MRVTPTSWVEIDAEAIRGNVRGFLQRVGGSTRLAAVVKSNAYGHGMLEVASLARQAGADWRVRFELVEGVRRYVAFKGSIAIDGVSLTVADVDERTFEVALVPTTLERTTLDGLTRGRAVNVEVDLLARYLESLMQGRDDG